MQKANKFKKRLLLSALIFISSMMVGGVSYAILQSQPATLTGNTIDTATANLLVSSDGVNYASSQQGYAFQQLVPGGQAMPQVGYPVWLKNGGGTALGLKFSISGTPSNPNNVDLSKVSVLLTPTGGGSPQSFPLSMLIAANSTGGIAILNPPSLMPGLSTKYILQVTMDSDAITGPGASLSNIVFSFGGVAQ